MDTLRFLAACSVSHSEHPRSLSDCSVCLEHPQVSGYLFKYLYMSSERALKLLRFHFSGPGPKSNATAFACSASESDFLEVVQIRQLQKFLLKLYGGPACSPPQMG